MRILSFLLCLVITAVQAQKTAYPFPVQYLPLRIEEKAVKMAYMDVKPEHANGTTVLLLHGKNFNGYYWKEVIFFLRDAGYRVIVPDQVGWGFSDKPAVHYSFSLLAANTKALLDTLHLRKVAVIAHSMGGMLATRFVVAYPSLVEKLVYENPIGLEDYQAFVPYHSIDAQFESELKADMASLRKYQQGYFPEWKDEYDQYVKAQYDALQVPDFRQATWASAVTYQMIWEQPQLYYFNMVKAPTLLIIGQADRTVVGKNALTPDEAARHGNYPALGKWLQGQISGSKLVELPGVGHIPHIQALDPFRQQVLAFLSNH